MRGIALALGFEIAFDAMFVPYSRGYTSTSPQPRTVVLHASNHSVHPISKKAIDILPDDSVAKAPVEKRTPRQATGRRKGSNK